MSSVSREKKQTNAISNKLYIIDCKFTELSKANLPNMFDLEQCRFTWC